MNPVTGIVGGLAGSLAERFANGVVGGQPSFASILSDRIAAASGVAGGDSAADVERLVTQLLDLPLTSDEAQSISSYLVALVSRLKSAADQPAQAAKARADIEAFIQQIKEKFLLSAEDSARLDKIAGDYIAKNIPIGLSA